jgi:hypothetical protein
VDQVEHHVAALRVGDREREGVADAAGGIDEGWTASTIVSGGTAARQLTRAPGVRTPARRSRACSTSPYHLARTHLSLDKDAPDRRPIEPAELGPVIPIPEVGGLHHRSVRRAA